MKKSFWGYDIREVDSNNEYMELQNAKLLKKINKLTEELDDLKAELNNAQSSEKKVISAESQLKTITEEKTQLEVKLDSVCAQLQVMTDNNNSLNEQLVKLKESKEHLEDVGEICRIAYEDMDKAKKYTRSSLDKFLQSFWEKWEVKLQSIYEAEKKISETAAASKESFLSAADQILQQYEVIASECNTDNDITNEASSTGNTIRAELEMMISSFQTDENVSEKIPDESEKKDSSETDDKEKSVFSHEILKLLTERMKKKSVAKINTITEGSDETNDNKTEQKDEIADVPDDIAYEIGVTYDVDARNVINK